MCDYYLQRMDNDQAGDLNDIFRSGGAIPSVAADLPSTAAEWQLPPGPMLFLPLPSSSDGAMPSGDVFGYRFTGLQESFGSDYSSGAADGLEAAPDATDASTVNVGFDAAVCGGGGGSGGGVGGGMLDMRKPIFPRGLKMPAVSPRAIRPYPVMGADMVKLGGPVVGQAVGPCAIDAVAGMQMPSPRASGIKRRKNQARKVVCIPAPAAAAGAAGGRPSGEVVPSDLWAWRKYGQKPIKGSPYPRGYYRCSSSKGCSARKQVERSRTDPNMLVITYTSEHNHPWPTQRNALAGSTRSHHANNNSSSNNNLASKNSSHNQKTNVKQEPKDRTTTAATTTPTTSTTTTTNTPPMVVKEEAMVGSEMEKFIDASVVVDHGELLHQVFSQSYKPMIPEAGHPDDFFADLAELEPDPTSLIFSKEYMEAKPSDGGHDQDKALAKGLDPFPFNMLD